MENMDKRKIFTLGLIVLLVLFIIVALIDTGKTMKNRRQPQTVEAPKAEATEIAPKKEEKKVKKTISSQVIRSAIADMGTLVTAEYNFTQVETFSKTKKIAYFFDVTSGFMYSYDGVVTAGVNFNGISVKKDEAAKVITVTVPAATIQNVEIDYNSFKVYSEKEGLWNPITLEDYNESQKDFDENARAMAKEKGLLKKADENAEKLVRNFVTSLVDEEDEDDYEIVIK